LLVVNFGFVDKKKHLRLLSAAQPYRR